MSDSGREQFENMVRDIMGCSAGGVRWCRSGDSYDGEWGFAFDVFKAIRAGNGGSQSLEPTQWRASIEKAIQLTSVFDDGGDGADDESARGVVSILNDLLAACPDKVVSEPSPNAFELGMIFRQMITGGSCHNGRDVQRVLAATEFSAIGVDPHSVDGNAGKWPALVQQSLR